MKKYRSEYGLQARNTPWPYRTSPDNEFEFEPFTRLVQMEEPKAYYHASNILIRFRVEGGTQDYFADWKHFNKHTDRYE